MKIGKDLHRLNVAAFVQNKEGKILFCHRRDEKYPTSGFQVPQGGVEPGETLEEALTRELEEEIFLTRFDIVAGPTSGICYLWDEGKRKSHHIGQCQYYFLISVSEGLEEIRPSEDFDFYRWVEPQTLVDEVVDFKKEVYREALRQLKLLQ